jgi:hypothetical protein
MILDRGKHDLYHVQQGIARVAKGLRGLSISIAVGIRCKMNLLPLMKHPAGNIPLGN